MRKCLVAARAVVFLSGCAAQPVAETTPTAEPSIESGTLVDVPAPAQVFDGDCATMFSDAALSEALGQPLTQPQFPDDWAYPISPESLLAENAGGIACLWGEPQTSPDMFSGTVLTVVALPASAVSAPEDTECAPSDLSATGCPIDVTSNGIRLSGLVTSDRPSDDPLIRVAAVEALFTERANAVEPPVAAAPLPAAWSMPANCDSIAASVDLASAFDSVGPTLSDNALGTDAYASVVEIDLRGGRVLYTCWLYLESHPNLGASFSLMGGGAWARDRVLAQGGATVVDLPQFELAVVTDLNATQVLNIFDGVNWLQSNGYDSETTPVAMTAIIEALNAQV